MGGKPVEHEALDAPLCSFKYHQWKVANDDIFQPGTGTIHMVSYNLWRVRRTHPY